MNQAQGAPATCELGCLCTALCSSAFSVMPVKAALCLLKLRAGFATSDDLCSVPGLGGGTGSRSEVWLSFHCNPRFARYATKAVFSGRSSSIASFLGKEGPQPCVSERGDTCAGKQLLAEVLDVFSTRSVAWEALGAELTWRFLCFSVWGAARRELWVRWLPVPARMFGCSVGSEMFLAS